MCRVALVTFTLRNTGFRTEDNIKMVVKSDFCNIDDTNVPQNWVQRRALVKGLNLFGQVIL
jgi:hypothetical protein